MRRRKIGKALDSASGKTGKRTLPSGSAPTHEGKRRGRPPALSEDELRRRRDKLQGLFEVQWPVIAWNLQRARKAIHITEALRPLADLKHPTIELLLLDSYTKPKPEGFLPFRRECKRLYSQVKEAQNRLDLANTRVTEARDAFEQVHSRFAAARDGYAEARKKKKKEEVRALLKEREKWSRPCESVQAELSRREKNLIEFSQQITGIEKEIEEIEAHFAQIELLRFVLSERYAFTPQAFANAAAGLPHMAWRTSMRRCSRVRSSAKTSINYLIFEAVKMIWNKRVQRRLKKQPEKSTVR